MAGVIASTVLAYGVNRVVNKLTFKDIKPPLATNNNTTSDRGTIIPHVIGQRMVEPFIGYVGNRRAEGQTEKTGKGGNEQTVGYLYYEKAWHVLCLGPVDRIDAIYANGKNILEEYYVPVGDPEYTNYWGDNADQPIFRSVSLTRDEYPSGSLVPCALGNFRIYWGDCDESAVNSVIAGNISIDGQGLASAYPGICYIVWDECRLGNAPVWPLLQYVVAVMPFTGGIDVTEWQEEPPGVNPAAAIWELLSAEWPRGAGIDPALLDKTAFETAAAVFASEGLYINPIGFGGKSYIDVINEILLEIGATMPQIGGQLVLHAVRTESTPPIIDADVRGLALPEIEIADDLRYDRVVWQYPNRAALFSVGDASADNDADSELRTQRMTQVNINHITDIAMLGPVIERRQQEAYIGPQTYRIDAHRNASDLAPGMAFVLTDFAAMRTINVMPDLSTDTVTIEAVVDAYHPDPYGATYTDYGYSGETGTGEPVQRDRSFAIAEVPPMLATSTLAPQLIPLIIRENTASISSSIYISDDGSTFAKVLSSAVVCAGGQLLEDMHADGEVSIDEGPTFRAFGPDIGNVQDLTAAESRWRSGEQIMYIDGEWFFVGGITAVSQNTYRIDKILRARLGTLRKSHGPDSAVFIFQASQILAFSSGLLAQDVTTYFKAVPYSSTFPGDLSMAAILEHYVRALSQRPLPVINLAGIGDSHDIVNQYNPGDDIVLTWSYRVVDSEGLAAGNQGAGVPIAATNDPDGPYLVRILDDDGSVIHEASVTDETYTYTNTQLITDWTTDPGVILIAVYQQKGNKFSEGTFTIVGHDTGVVLTDSDGSILSTEDTSTYLLEVEA